MGLLTKYDAFQKETSKGIFRYALEAATWKTPEWLFAYFHTYILGTNNPRIVTRSHDSYFKRFATSDDLHLLSQFGVPPRVAEERLRDGDQCVIMGQGDELMSMLWASSERRYLKFSGTILDPGKNGVIYYGGYTKEEVRLRGFFPISFKEMYDSYMQRGRDFIYAAVSSTNLNSLKLHQRMRFEVIGEAFSLTILGLSICYYRKWPHPTRKLHIFFRRPPEDLRWI